MREVIFQFLSFCVLDSGEQGVIATVSPQSQAFFITLFFCEVLLLQERGKRLTCHWSLKLLQSSHSPPPVEGSGWLGKMWCPAVARTRAGPRRGPQRLGHPEQEEGLSQPYPSTFSQAISRAIKKSYKTSLFLIFPGPEISPQPVEVARGREPQGH